MKDEQPVVRRTDGTAVPLLDWLKSDSAYRFLGCEPPFRITMRQVSIRMLVAFAVGLLLGSLIGAFLF